MLHGSPEEAVTVSVCIPCVVDHLPYLVECIESIARQTSPPEEIVVRLSGAVDDVLSFIEKRVRPAAGTIALVMDIVPHEQFAGPNRNAAVARATGNIITFIDADDCMRRERVAIIRSIFRDPTIVGMLHYFCEDTMRAAAAAVMPPPAFDHGLLRPYEYTERLHFGHPTFRRTVFEQYQYTDRHRGQDIEFVDRIIRSHRKDVCIYAAELTDYRPERSTFFGSAASPP